jgi:hypothetical protein
MKKTAHKQLLPFTFRVAFVWYMISLVCELLFPGMASHVIDLDFFLWVVILLGVFSFLIKRIERHV